MLNKTFILRINLTCSWYKVLLYLDSFCLLVFKKIFPLYSMRDIDLQFYFLCHLGCCLLLTTPLSMGFSNYCSKSNHFPSTVKLLVIHHLPYPVGTPMKKELGKGMF